jgi:hypothetical protein
VVDDQVVVTNTGNLCRTLLLIGSFALIPYAFIGECTRTVEHRLSVEARAFDLAGAPLAKVQDPRSSEILNVYDTSGREPLLRREYAIVVEVEASLRQSHDPDAMQKAGREEAKEAVRQLVTRAAEDIRAALGAQAPLAGR